jgi:hypothetical protein
MLSNPPTPGANGFRSPRVGDDVSGKTTIDEMAHDECAFVPIPFPKRKLVKSN